MLKVRSYNKRRRDYPNTSGNCNIQQEQEEKFVVADTYTVFDPAAVVVEAMNASPAL